MRPGDLGGPPPGLPGNWGLGKEVGDSVGLSSAREVWATRPLPMASACDRYLFLGASAAPFKITAVGGRGWGGWGRGKQAG